VTVRSIRYLVLVLLAAVLASGCGGSDRHEGVDSARHGQQSVVATDGGLSVPVRTGVALAGFPTCDEVKATLGPGVDGLVAPARRGTGVTLGVDGPSLARSWPP
jgi:hypothetical protein